MTRAGENQVIRHFLVTNSMSAVLNVMTIVVYMIIMFTYSVLDRVGVHSMLHYTYAYRDSAYETQQQEAIPS
ncbi:hypothetical protein ASL11_35080 [Paenibacillus sp. Soil750]|nr:hypothetical protein ASL11_35080 [Paenibacillus sp. Soil750]